MDSKVKTAVTFFRMGLVTGLVKKEAMVAWAEREILRETAVADAIIELALSGHQPHSQLIWLLGSLEGAPDYEVAPKLLFAHAHALLTADETQAEPIVMGLRLLNEEEYFPKQLQTPLNRLVKSRHLLQEGELDAKDLSAQLKTFLEPYKVHHLKLLEMFGKQK